MKLWEEQISLYPSSDLVRERVEPAFAYADDLVRDRFERLDFKQALKHDQYPLPSKQAREGYYGDEHLNYWLSGLYDANELVRIYEEKIGKKPEYYMDFGGASGRVARHMACQHNVKDVWVSDINREHINFIQDVFQGGDVTLIYHVVIVMEYPKLCWHTGYDIPFGHCVESMD